MDVFTIAVFFATLAALLVAYAVWRGLSGAMDRVQLESDMGATRMTARDGGRYVGGSDKPGSN